MTMADATQVVYEELADYIGPPALKLAKQLVAALDKEFHVNVPKRKPAMADVTQVVYEILRPALASGGDALILAKKINDALNTIIKPDRSPKRRFVQITAWQKYSEPNELLVALADDGTVWYYDSEWYEMNGCPPSAGS
jgi:hypothetical protein